MHPTSIFEAGHQLQIITLWDSIVQEYRHSHVSIGDTNTKTKVFHSYLHSSMFNYRAYLES